MLKVLIPENEPICRTAAGIFTGLWQQITGESLPVIHRDEPDASLIVLGSDAVNAFSHDMIIREVIPQFQLTSGMDDYRIRSAADSGRKLLFLAGGRPRALLYAVYRFFELQAGCRYFWDGDIIPSRPSISIDGLDILERPRFQYRGLRYFAHRSLTRFQAEHWTLEDWKKEIDWILKKRLNLFMLRIGLDDLFQQAFPEAVPYPENYQVPEAKDRSYDDRNLFWSLQTRGELRRQLLAYARERDLLHPEDTGTMTHWYSRTPHAFLDHEKPDFLPQATAGYNQSTGLVWDIRKNENLEKYWKLTETHIEKYGSPDIFHTIGLAERNCYSDRKLNQQMKLYTYRRIQQILRKHYPDAPLLVGTWDFGMYWKPQEVRSLLRELNPANTLILDYTSDTSDEKNNFLNWGLVGKFPWIAGIFHAYEPASDIRGNYTQIEERLPVIADDPMCRGLIYWPECSHTDTLMLEFFTENAWQPGNGRIEDFLPVFCSRRYPGHEPEMTAVWQKMLPLIRSVGWPGPKDPLRLMVSFSDFIFKLFSWTFIDNLTAANLELLQRHVQAVKDSIPAAPDIFRDLAGLCSAGDNEFIHRDLIDLGRTAVSRLQTYAFARMLLTLEDWRNGLAGQEEVFRRLDSFGQTAVLENALLDAHEDYSLTDSLKRLREKYPCNPEFEHTLKGNAENFYCRSYISELFSGLYLPEWNLFAEIIRERIRDGRRTPWTEEDPEIEKRAGALRDSFYSTPLESLAPDHEKARKALPETFRKLAETAEAILAGDKKK